MLSKSNMILKNSSGVKMKKRIIGFVEDLRKNELDNIILMPIFTLMFLDMASSYLGICYYGGIELNMEAINLAYRFGILGANSLYMFFYLVLGLVVCWKLLYERNVYFKMFLMGLFAIYFVAHLKVVVANMSTLLFQATGIPPAISHAPATKELIKFFDRARFCRLFP